MDNRPDEPWKTAGGKRAIAFVKQHGGNPVWDSYKRCYLLPDGAVMSLDGRQFADPPTDPMRQLNQRRLYFQLVVERTIAHLEELASVGRGEKLTVRWRVEIYGPKPGPTLNDAHKHLTDLLGEQRAKRAELDAEYRRIHDRYR